MPKGVPILSEEQFTKTFWEKVNVRGEDECWEWTGFRNDRQYGQLRHGSHTCKAHRVAYELSNGDIPDGMLVCHSCDNPPCCNPSHLWLGTDKDNVSDMIVKGRRDWSKADYAYGHRNGSYTHPERRPYGDRNGARLHPGIRRGERNGRAKISMSDARRIRELKREGMVQRRIAEMVKVTEQQVSKIVRNKIWKED